MSPIDKKKVGILGSCVSRDSFEIAPHNSLERVLYTARTNFLSINSDGLTEGKDFRFKVDPTAPPSKWRFYIAKSDLTKYNRTLLLSELPKMDGLIVDLIDDRFDTAVLEDGRCCLLSEEHFENTEITVPHSRHCLITDTQWREQWIAAAVSFFGKVFSLRPGLRVLFHHAPFCLQGDSGLALDDPDYMRGLGSERFIARWQESVELLLGRIEEAYPGRVKQIEVEQKYHLAYTNHRWGLAPIHYIDEYYRDLLERVANDLGNQ